MAILKWKNAKDWISFYVDSIALRLRKDKNLSDVNDVVAARNNLELSGVNNHTHYHDDHYMPLINREEKSRTTERDSSSFCITGDVEAPFVGFTNDMKVMLQAKNVIATTTMINDGSNIPVKLTGASNTGIQQIRTTGVTADAAGNLTSTSVQSGSISGTVANFSTVNAQKVYNAIWNDYAEFFPRGGETNPGDLIMLDIKSKKEQYIRATKDAQLIVGVHSDEFAMLIGGEKPAAGEDYFKTNIEKYIPVALAGRVHVNFTGASAKGGKVVPSDIPGYARLYNPEKDTLDRVIGYLVESDDSTGERKLKIKIGR
jgi:hypothetical protein